MHRLTPTELQHLQKIKYNKKKTLSKAHAGNGYRQESLWNVLITYMQIINRPYFKARYFRKDDRFKHKWINKNYIMSDCPLEMGELINAIKYGQQQGYLQKTGSPSNIRWYITEKAQQKYHKENQT